MASTPETGAGPPTSHAPPPHPAQGQGPSTTTASNSNSNSNINSASAGEKEAPQPAPLQEPSPKLVTSQKGNPSAVGLNFQGKKFAKEQKRAMLDCAVGVAPLDLVDYLKTAGLNDITIFDVRVRGGESTVAHENQPEGS